jgi:outer membrane biosynthesis protein TonB
VVQVHRALRAAGWAAMVLAATPAFARPQPFQGGMLAWTSTTDQIRDAHVRALLDTRGYTEGIPAGESSEPQEEKTENTEVFTRGYTEGTPAGEPSEPQEEKKENTEVPKVEQADEPMPVAPGNPGAATEAPQPDPAAEPEPVETLPDPTKLVCEKGNRPCKQARGKAIRQVKKGVRRGLNSFDAAHRKAGTYGKLPLCVAAGTCTV